MRLYRKYICSFNTFFKILQNKYICLTIVRFYDNMLLEVNKMEKKFKELTEKQNNVLDFIKRFTATHGYPPSIREIGKGLNLSSPATVHTHVKNLCKAGYLKVDNNKFRAP